MPLKAVMTPRGSLTTILTTMIGASLGGLILWRVFRTQRKKLPPVQEVAQLVRPVKEEVTTVECQSTKTLAQPALCPVKEEVTTVECLSARIVAQQPVSSSTPVKKELKALDCTPTLHCIEKEIEAVSCQTATAQLSPSVWLPSPEQLLGVKPVIVSSEEQWDHLWPSLQKELSLFPVLGLDCDWVKHTAVRHSSVSAKRFAVSLLQIASYSGLCILVRLVSFRGGQQSFPLSLIEVLRDPHILKVGVGCYEDGKRLTRTMAYMDYGLSLGGTVDLRYLALRQGCRQVALNNGLSLQSLAADVLNVSLDKSLKLRCSDWEADQLTLEQMTYAARDSQVSIAIFFHLLGLNPGASSPATTGCTYSQLAACCQGLIDVPFRQRTGEGKTAVGERRQRLRKPPCDSPESGDQQVPDPRKNNKKNPGYSARKSPLYDNCFLHAPDGQPLCTCDKKKAMWYLSKGIGELQSEDPFIVRLLFEPSGRPDSHQDYYLTAKENLCVVCGKADSYIRKNIVPHEYRRHFPNEMKDHNSHDILLLCTACHAASNIHDNMLKQHLAEEYGAPQGCEEGVRMVENSDRRRVRSAARALLTARDSLPDDRLEELEAVVRGFYCDVESEADSVQSDECNAPLSPQALQTASSLETRIFNEAYIPHGLKVVYANAEKGLRGLMELERRWRQHFLTCMKPRHLPPLWSVCHNHSKFLSKYGENLPIHLH